MSRLIIEFFGFSLSSLKCGHPDLLMSNSDNLEEDYGRYVIIAIFNRLDNTRNWSFDAINSILKNHYTNEQIEVWDDLWFWGFNTQNGSGTQRTFECNENKYWIIIESDKHPETIRKVRDKAEEFLSMLRLR